MITPRDDKDVIKAILDTDNYIKRAKFKPENIKTTKASGDIISANNPDFRINIYIGKPEKGSSELVKNVTYGITVSGSRKFCNVVDCVAEQIVALLDGKNIGRGHVLYILDTPMELESDPSIYILAMAFLCQSTMVNTPKK